MAERQERARAMVWGALVADAASMGLHWLYDQARIAQVAGDRPEFHGPDAADYDGVPGYFAHGGRVRGMPSQYGEQMLVMLRALADGGGQYDKSGYEAAFRAHFGYGGAYVGYIDRATRDTLDNLAVAERAASALPDSVIRIGESGVSSIEGAARMRAAGYDAILVGEALVRHPDPAHFVADLKGA